MSNEKITWKSSPVKSLQNGTWVEKSIYTFNCITKTENFRRKWESWI